MKNNSESTFEKYRAKKYNKILNTADVDGDVEMFISKMLDNKNAMDDPELSKAVVRLYGIYKKYSYGHIYDILSEK